MSSMLSFASVALTAFGVLFTLIYLCLQLFDSAADPKRSKGLLRAMRYAMLLSLIFAFLSFLLGKEVSPAEAVRSLSRLYSVITVCWLGAALLCGVAAAWAFISRAAYRDERVQAIRRAFVNAVFGAVFGGALTWLLG